MSRDANRDDPELRVVRAAGRRLAVATAAAITLVLVAVGALAAAVVWREQASETRRALRQAVVDLDDLRNTPPGTEVWVRSGAGRVQATPGAPLWLPVPAAVRDVVSSAAARDERTVNRGGSTYRLLTIRRGGLVAQAVTSTDPERDERARLLTALLVAELTGLALSVVLGTVLARRATAPLAAAMRRQRRFVADASHELRTPLTLLSTRAQLLERSLRTSSAGQGAGAAAAEGRAAHAESQALVADARRLAEVVDDLLLSASLAQEPAHREPLDLADIVTASAAAARAHADEQGVSLQVQAAPAVVLGAAGPLRRVVDALVDNALTHTPSGGCVSLRVSAGPPVTLDVIDDGSGISPSMTETLFDRFAHGSSARGRRHFGLGLAMVREIVQAHGGSVAARPTPGGGATFTVVLPEA